MSKYCDHLPLYRRESILGRLGWDVPRSTLCDQIIASAGVLEPLYRLMCDRVRLSAALHTDDTPVPLLAPRRTAHAWVYVGDAANPYTVFDLSVGRGREFPAAFLKDFKGFLQVDGYAGYDPLYEAGARHAGCWAHARRYFFDARLSDPERAHETRARIRALSAVEQAAEQKGLTGTDLAAYRQQHRVLSWPRSPTGWPSSVRGCCRSPRSARRVRTPRTGGPPSASTGPTAGWQSTTRRPSGPSARSAWDAEPHGPICGGPHSGSGTGRGRAQTTRDVRSRPHRPLYHSSFRIVPMPPGSW